jgi:hypothetical protein
MSLKRVRNALITATVFIGVLGLLGFLLLHLLPYIITILVLVVILQLIFAGMRRL